MHPAPLHSSGCPGARANVTILFFFFFFFETKNLYSYIYESSTEPNTSKEKPERKQRAAPLQHSFFHIEDSKHARPPSSQTPQDPAASSTHRRNGRTPSPKAKTSRSNHQLRRAGSEDKEAPSAGDAPQAPAVPGPGPAPTHLTRGGQNLHLHATNPRSSTLRSSPPTSFTPTANLPPAPERTPAGQSSSHPPSSKTPTEARGGCSPTKRRRWPPHLGHLAHDPPEPSSIYTAGAPIRGFPTLQIGRAHV